MDAPKHELITVPGVGEAGRDELRQQCYDVRIAVFIDEQGFPLDVEIDEADETATHFLLRLVPALTPVGTIRAYRSKDGSYYKLSRLAVLKDYRKYGWGRELVLALHNWVVQDATSQGLSGPVPVVCHSQIPVKRFYAKLGYVEEGAEFDEDGAPHQKMVARLSI
ncbi:acyl-CoA N-acyltransferase [Gloeophyllum trabeum ATCC 11539]|uniref:Acyl-CoA N-acyltransferase n=1 Tax=Gloeophyllum trabeum (strain ATCC 11539 / FP-39264 / Madison 617) TaxID=670483 RepID=S7QIL9_GLOTA|nr:acyl-CoA N-acyltransferase [Gloeophyllum trabeum ATCC 11539]EPQ59153.1 acyl-CoA N-acyltransferase [Gloeophyllum trabeum ATCC 11539]